MKLIPALAVTIGVLGGVATYLVFDTLAALHIQIWAVFIAWASFFSAGGTNGAFTKSGLGNLWGVLIATVTLIVNAKFSTGVPVTAVIIGASIVVLVLAAQLPMLDAIPAHFYGYASTAGFALLAKDASPLSFDLGTGVFTTVALSMIVGALFGLASAKIAGMLTK